MTAAMATTDESVHVVSTMTGLALRSEAAMMRPEMARPRVPFNEVTIMNKMQSAWLGLCLVVLAATSCDFPRLPKLDSLQLLAGNIGGPGNVDGSGANAHFNGPSGVAVDSAGNVYVADAGNHTIRKVSAAGVVTTLAGMDGTGAAASFFDPFGVAIDSAGNIYVADFSNHTICKMTAAGVVTTLAGTAGMAGNADGTGAAARFYQPMGVAVDSAGNVYVTDFGNFTIRKVTAAGVVTTLAGTAGMAGSADGTSAAARFYQPMGVAVDSAGNVYVADFGNYTIRKVTAAGVVTTLAGTADMAGSADGTGVAARFYEPAGVAVDGAGNVYVTDRDNATIRKVTAAGVVTTLAGTAGMYGSADGTGAAARFSRPIGVAVDGAGNVYVADRDNTTIRKVTTAGAVATLAGTAGWGSADGTGRAARFHSASGVAVDSAGNAYVADQGNHTIRKLTAAGAVTTLAGTAGMVGGTDGTGAAARFYQPSGVAVDSVGNIYVADYGNHTIRKVTAAGVVTTLAGTAGIVGSTDGMGAAARFNFPADVAVDSADNVYVADTANSTIRKVTAAGVVTTLAGTAGISGGTDGTGAAARFYQPTGVAVDGAGNIYVADYYSSTIRKVTTAGVVTTLAGTAVMVGSADGTGAVVRFDHPTSVAVDSAGNVYVADQGNSTIRKVTPTGTTTTIAGTAGMAGILPGETPRFAFPQNLVIVDDYIMLSDTDAILLLRPATQ